MPYFSHDQLDFHYLQRGNGQPVFFQHGLGGGTRKIFDLIQLPPGFRLLGLDCRAHGETKLVGPPAKLRFDIFADDVVALMDRLEISAAVVGGTSMGAGVALNCALRHSQRVRGLVLLRPAWLDEPNHANVHLFGLIARLLRENGPVLGLELFLKSHEYRMVAQKSSDAAGSLVGLFQDPRAIETIARLEQLPGDAPNRDRREWASIKTPTLVLSTRQDPIHPFEFGQMLARQIPDAQFCELTPKAINLAQYTSELNQCLSRFLQTTSARQAEAGRNK